MRQQHGESKHIFSKMNLKLIHCSNQLATYPNVEILQPPVAHYPPLQWDKLDEIVTKGYEYAKPVVDAWIANKVFMCAYFLET